MKLADGRVVVIWIMYLSSFDNTRRRGRMERERRDGSFRGLFAGRRIGGIVVQPEGGMADIRRIWRRRRRLHQRRRRRRRRIQWRQRSGQFQRRRRLFLRLAARHRKVDGRGGRTECRAGIFRHHARHCGRLRMRAALHCSRSFFRRETVRLSHSLRKWMVTRRQRH